MLLTFLLCIIYKKNVARKSLFCCIDLVTVALSDFDPITHFFYPMTHFLTQWPSFQRNDLLIFSWDAHTKCIARESRFSFCLLFLGYKFIIWCFDYISSLFGALSASILLAGRHREQGTWWTRIVITRKYKTTTISSSSSSNFIGELRFLGLNFFFWRGRDWGVMFFLQKIRSSMKTKKMLSIS